MLDPTSLFNVAAPGEPPPQYAGAVAGLRAFQSIAQFRQAYALPYDTQIVIDRIPVEVGVERLRLVTALLAAGLIYSVPNWLSIPSILSEKLSRSGEAIDTFEPDVRLPDGRQDRQPVYLPLYCTMAGFKIGMRMQAIADRIGLPIDTSEAAERVRRVQERIEYTFINGKTETVNGYSVYGLLNAPNANAFAYGSNLAWDDPTKTGQNIFDDWNGMRGALQADAKFGPYIGVVGTAYSNKLDVDFKANGTLSIRQRLLGANGIQGIDGLRDIVTVDRMPKDKTALIQATPDVVRVVYGQSPTAISWQDNNSPLGGWRFAWVACMIPQFRSDYEGNSGICIGNPT